MKPHQSTTIVLALLAASTGAAVAQQPVSSARPLGLANSYSARAGGYEAPFWNPANLGMPRQPNWSLGILGAAGYLTSNSLSYGQISDLYGEFIDEATKAELLADIRNSSDGNFTLNADLGASALSASIWRFAFGFGAVGAGNTSLSSDAVELLLYGNVGQDGTGKDFDLEDTEGNGWALSSAFLSYAQPFTLPALDHLGMRFSVGATVKYGMANGLANLTDRGSILTWEPLAASVQAEALVSTEFDAGRFWSVDLGIAMDWDALTAGIALMNAFGNIAWDPEVFELTVVTADVDFEESTSSDTTVAFDELSPDDQDRVRAFLDEADLPRRLRLGAEYRLSPKLSLSGDYVELIGGNLRTRWDRALSAGAELTLLSVLPLRAGLATDFKNAAITGGLGVYAGPMRVDFSLGRWGFTSGDGVVAALSVAIWP